MEKDEKIYPTLESAREALERGEQVRIEVGPIYIRQELLQVARELQDKQSLQEWLHQQKQ